MGESIWVLYSFFRVKNMPYYAKNTNLILINMEVKDMGTIIGIATAILAGVFLELIDRDHEKEKEKESV